MIDDSDFIFAQSLREKKCFCWCHTNTLGTILRRFPQRCSCKHWVQLLFDSGSSSPGAFFFLRVRLGPGWFVIGISDPWRPYCHRIWEHCVQTKQHTVRNCKNKSLDSDTVPGSPRTAERVSGLAPQVSLWGSTTKGPRHTRSDSSHSYTLQHHQQEVRVSSRKLWQHTEDWPFCKSATCFVHAI